MTRLKERLALGALALLAMVNLGAWTRTAFVHGIHTDFASYLTFAYLGVHVGWPHLYDWEMTRPFTRLFQSSYWPNQYPPFTMLLVVPLLFVPYPVAYFVWLGLMVAATLAAWRLLAPARGRLAYLLLLLACLPVGFCWYLGQVVPLVLLAVAASWRLLEDRRDFLGGLVLAGVLFKPNLALLVPLVLIVHGRWRGVAGFAAGCAVAAVIAAVVLQPYGLAQYVSHLRTVSVEQTPLVAEPSMTPVSLIGVGPALLALDLAVVAAVVAVARMSRREGLAAGFAAAMVGSLLVTTYLHWQDLLMLIPAGWLWLRTRPDPRLAVPCLALVWLTANFTVAVPQVEIAWLAILSADAGWRVRTQPRPLRLEPGESAPVS